MRALDVRPLYRHGGAALLRAAAVPLTDAPAWWPDPGDEQSCRMWLEQAWSVPWFADAVRQASPGLAASVDAIRAGRAARVKRVRRATLATARYLLRASGRPTPFGLFAGVVSVSPGPTARVRWGERHRATARADTLWLADVIERLEASPELLERLDVVFSSLAVRRGGRLEAPRGPDRVTVRHTSAVQAVREASASPVRFAVLVDKLAEAFPGADRPTVRNMVTGLVRQGFLITCLRAGLTVTDPLGRLVDRLHEAGADELASVAAVVRDLDAIRADLRRHNHEVAAGAGQRDVRAALTERMNALSCAERTPLAVDLLLDCDLRLPRGVLYEMARAAGAMLRLTRRPGGDPAWRTYHAAFCDRYGTGTLVPVTEVVDPDAGLGYPAGYPGSVLPAPTDAVSERDERLLALAWQALADGSREVALTDEEIRALAGDGFDGRHVPPHVELAARIHAASREALDSGEYTLTVAPARAAGTLTSRFTPVATGSGLEDVYRTAPTGAEDALPVQMSFPPVYSHAENIARVPAYLPHVLSLGEHRGEAASVIPVEDLAVTATRDRLHLVSLSRRRVIEPQVFHALALQKQAPPLARFLAHLPRAFSPVWHEFDWGPAALRLPYLPRLRYGRTVISPARWRLTTGDLPTDPAGGEWQPALDRWRRRWRCPDTVELRDADRTLRLTFDESAHTQILREHLRRHGHAVLTEAATAEEFCWIDGHAHEIAVPLLRTGPPAPTPVITSMPELTNHLHGQPPGSAQTEWLYAKIYAHPERHDEIITDHLPRLLDALHGRPDCWLVRYRSNDEPDHLRLRLRIRDTQQLGGYAAAVGDWVQRLRQDGLVGRLVFDTYYPEVGRYGSGAAMRAAEAVFAADSRAVSAALRHLPATGVHPTALAAANMVDIVCGFHTDRPGAMRWLIDRPAPTGAAADRAVAHQAVHLALQGALADLPDWPREVNEAWQARAAALADYRRQLPIQPDTDAILESLLHMHHNRAIGIDPDAERTCRRLARQAALTWRAQQ